MSKNGETLTAGFRGQRAGAFQNHCKVVQSGATGCKRNETAPKPDRHGAFGAAAAVRLRVLVFERMAEPGGMLAGSRKSDERERRLSGQLQAIAPPGWLVESCRSVEEAMAVMPKKPRPAKAATQPECVAVVELAGHEREGINFVRPLRMAAPELPILVLSEAKGRRALEALMAGASGHLYVPQTGRQVLTALQCMIRGEAVLCQRSEEAIVRTLWGTGCFEAGHKLTPRLQVVMAGLLRGLHNKEIAAEMGIAEGTVHSQLEEIYRKLEVHNRAEAVRKYLGLSGAT